MTNADKIRSMTDEELADILSEHECDKCIYRNLHYYECEEKQCKDGILEWLEKEAEE